MRARKQNSNGFTIVELLIVIVVIAILAAITIVAYNGITSRAKAASVRSDLTNGVRKLETLKISDGSDSYPASLSDTGLIPSGDNTLKYSSNNSPKLYCLSATNGTFSQYVTNLNTTPQDGSCATVSGLIAWWPLNGNVNDMSGNGNNLTNNGAVTTTGQNGNINGAYSLGETNQWFNLPQPPQFNNLGTTGFTYSLWVKRTGTTAGHWPNVMGYSSHYSWAILSGNYGDSIYFEFAKAPYDGSIYNSTGAAANIAIGTWHLLSVTYDGTSARWYVDGVEKGSALGIALNPTVTSALNFSCASGGWKGDIDDVRIYNRALSAAEVSGLFNAGAL